MPAVTTAPDFLTDRLNVFRIEVKSSEICSARSVFLGFFNDEEIPFPVVTATIWVHGPYFGHTLETIDTQEQHRLQGLATELWLGIEEHLDGTLWLNSSTVPGLVTAVNHARERAGRPRQNYDDRQVREQIERAFARQRALEGSDM